MFTFIHVSSIIGCNRVSELAAWQWNFPEINFCLPPLYGNKPLLAGNAVHIKGLQFVYAAPVNTVFSFIPMAWWTRTHTIPEPPLACWQVGSIGLFSLLHTRTRPSTEKTLEKWFVWPGDVGVTNTQLAKRLNTLENMKSWTKKKKERKMTKKN